MDEFSSKIAAKFLEEIRDLARRDEYLEFVSKIDRSNIAMPGVEEEFRKLFSRCDDDEVMGEFARRLRASPSSANGAFSGAALALTGSPKAVHYLMEAFKEGGGFGSSINDVALNGIVKEALVEIGMNGLEAMLEEMEKRGRDFRMVACIGKAIRAFITPDVRDSLIGGLAIENCDARREIVNILEEMGWVPETDQQKAIALVAHKDWAALEAMGAAAEPVLIETLGMWGVDSKNTIKCLGKVGGRKTVETFIQMLEGGSGYCRNVMEALATIGDPRAIRAILTHAKSAKRLWKPRASVYARVLAKFGEDAIPGLQAALKSERKIGEKALNLIG